MDEDDEYKKIKEKLLNDISNSIKNNVQDINEKTFYKFITENDKVIIDFWAPWCAPCHILSPLVLDLGRKYNIKVGKVNGDENMKLLMQYQITGLPTVLFFKDGNLAGRSVGVVPENVLEEKLKWLM